MNAEQAYIALSMKYNLDEMHNLDSPQQVRFLIDYESLRTKIIESQKSLEESQVELSNLENLIGPGVISTFSSVGSITSPLKKSA